jgi:hypothetical protein
VGQTTGVPRHTPFWHASDVVQASPSLQAVPFALGTAEHVPVAGVQVPVLHPFVFELQSTGAPDRHDNVARLHVSLPSQPLPSSQS